MITNWIRRFLLTNVELKAVSLLLATLLWFQIAGQETVQRTMLLPIELVNMAEQLQVSNDYPRDVEVTVRSDRGPEVLDDQDMAILIDLEGKGAGPDLVILRDEQIRNLPTGVEVLRIEPDRIRLELENTLRRLVAITPEIEGTPGTGYEVTDVLASPREVMISGPESHVQNVSTAHTEPIDVEGRTESMTVETFVDLEDPQLRIENTASVSVSVTIEEKRREITIRGVRVVRLPEDSASTALRRSVTVVGTVPLSFAGEIKAQDIEAQVDVSGLEPQNQIEELAPTIVVSEEYRGVFRLTSVAPERVRVRIR